jgi:hypothetical protein
MKIHAKRNSIGIIYATIWRNGEVDVMDKELHRTDINLTNNANRTLIDYDEGFCGVRFTFVYNCEPYDLKPSEDKWVVSWTLVEENWEDIPDKVYAFMDKQLEVVE